ncbi:hypothetical protein CK203_023107 [Vitis vinifera]|uniref:Uncharacterized protein n=1 Tax=Vitis vinifera TaxID=29760 RepID=A0A438J449_VITVI|nr:hypothetical protein CK203_023107 [Vitis vinifera]
MGTNKERIEQLKDGLHRMEVGMADRLRQVEENLNRLSDVLFANSENPILGQHHQPRRQWWGTVGGIFKNSKA